MNKVFVYSGSKALYFNTKNDDKSVLKCPILLYHSIGDDAIPPRLMAEHIHFLSSRFQLMTLNSLYQGVINGNLPQNPLVITFDDGYRDNYELALLILEKYQVTATVFIATGYIGGQFQGKPTMSPEQIKSLVSHGIEIGGHSVTHPNLKRLNLGELREELTSSKARLEDITGVKVISFAYPTGLYNSRVVEMVKEAGFKIAVTTVHDFLVNPHRLFKCPRLLVYPYESCEDIQAKLNGDQHWLKLAHKLFIPTLSRLGKGGSY
ncbi:polysaccharide deacetylase family protein [Chloroflexota bacterium]